MRQYIRWQILKQMARKKPCRSKALSEDEALQQVADYEVSAIQENVDSGEDAPTG